MKKNLFLLIVGLILSVTGFSQNVVYDKTDYSGVRTVICSGVNLGVSNNMDVYVALVGFKYKSTVRYAIAVSVGSVYKITIPETSSCSITLANQKNYDFPVVAGGTSILESVDVQMDDVYKAYKRFAYYTIKKKYLKRFSKSAITQFELRILPRDFSVGFNRNSLGDNLTAAYANLNNLFKN